MEDAEDPLSTNLGGFCSKTSGTSKSECRCIFLRRFKSLFQQTDNQRPFLDQTLEALQSNLPLNKS
jgi:hypothetical protein